MDSLSLIHLQVKHPLGSRDWRELGRCQKVIQHCPEGGEYHAVAVNSEGLLAVTDSNNRHVHLLSKEGALVRSIGKGFGGPLFGVTFDTKWNVWVTDVNREEIVRLRLDGQHLPTIRRIFNFPEGVSVSPEGLIYICDSGNCRITVHDGEGKLLFTFGSRGSGPGCFDKPRDITFASDDLVYVTDSGYSRVFVWSKEGTFQRDFHTKYTPTCIAATSDNHLVITSIVLCSVMVYTLHGQLVHEFGGKGSHPGKFNGPWGICVDEDGLVYVAEWKNRRVQVF